MRMMRVLRFNRFYRFFRVLRFFKIIKLVKFTSLGLSRTALKRLQKIKFTNRCKNFTSLMIIYFLGSHWLACIWFLQAKCVPLGVLHLCRLGMFNEQSYRFRRHVPKTGWWEGPFPGFPWKQQTSIFCCMNGHHNQYILVDTIFNYCPVHRSFSTSGTCL